MPKIKPTFKVGDIIKSLDFPHDATCYMIGRVTKISGDFYHCRTIARVWNGAADSVIRKGAEGFQVPFIGLMIGDSKYPNRITKIM